MESVHATLAARALQKHQSVQKNGTQPQQQRTIIALAGPPGSGKSTVASAVARLLNQAQHASFAVVLPMDGFHLPRSALDALPNRAEAYARRGAAWTFDAPGVLELVKLLHRSKTRAHKSDVILAPSFDHALKDPTADSITITPDMSIIILEGNWLLLDVEPWRQITALVDDTWFVDVAPGLARERIAHRHLQSGIETTWADALARADGNDLRNGDEVRTKLVEPNMRVWSVEAKNMEAGTSGSTTGNDRQTKPAYAGVKS